MVNWKDWQRQTAGGSESFINDNKLDREQRNQCLNPDFDRLNARRENIHDHQETLQGQQNR